MPELREAVLKHLPFHDLERCRWVNKAFGQTIASSKRLRQNLFLEADIDADFEVCPPLASFARKKKRLRSALLGEKVWKHTIAYPLSATEYPSLTAYLLLSQPPVTCLWISMVGADQRQARMIYREQGIRNIDVSDTVRSTLSQRPESLELVAVPPAELRPLDKGMDEVISPTSMEPCKEQANETA